jgi:hypothetical protein
MKGGSLIPQHITVSRNDSVFFRVSSISFWTRNVFPQSVRSGIVEEVEGELEIFHEDRNVGAAISIF